MKKLSLEAGDKVIIREDLEVNEDYDTVRFASGMANFRGEEVTIAYDNERLRIEEDGEEWFWSIGMIDVEKTLQLQSRLTKSDLKSGHVVETKEGQVFIVMIDEFDMGGDYIFNQYAECHMPLDEYSEDLQMIDRHYDCLDICKVYQPLYNHSIRNIKKEIKGEYDREDFRLVWERQKPKKMTLAEIEEVLGYPVEVVE